MPTAGPFIAAITGLGMVRRRVSIGMYSFRRTLPTSSGVLIWPSPTISVTSAPEQKARPDPVSTTTRTASSFSACLIASPSCFRVSVPIAFIFSGRLKRIHPMPPSASTFMCGSTSVAISASFEHPPPFFQERVHALFLVLGREQEVKALALCGQALGQRRLECLEHRLLGHAQGERRFLRGLPRD